MRIYFASFIFGCIILSEITLLIRIMDRGLKTQRKVIRNE